ncbi:hypothetical protein JZ751_022983 [Albula glossodonta]|uniref:Uncharacterized protein n=1 Tax=Albula glossodonta TaxID=121402 RepID=A0A8T2PMK2_9TELE|nr:hypothetical protein JZ751_022983 [Albula glossodonta]
MDSVPAYSNWDELTPAETVSGSPKNHNPATATRGPENEVHQTPRLSLVPPQMASWTRGESGGVGVVMPDHALVV